MKVIISSELKGKDFSQFVCAKSLEEVKNYKGVDTIILHKTDEKDFTIGVVLSDLRNKLGNFRFIYINEHPRAVIQMCLKGVGGYSYTDEFYLDDEEELLSLLADIDDIENSSSSDDAKNELALVAASNFEVVYDFMRSFARGEERVNAPIYQEQVNEAINQLSLITQEQNTQIVSMGSTAMNIFAKASTLVENMQTMQTQMNEQLARVEAEAIKAQNSRPALGGSINYFPPIKYMATAKILSIKEYSPCRYLVSYFLAFKHWLHVVHGKSVRLIIVTGKLVTPSTKYSKLGNTITESNCNIKTLLTHDLLIVESPKKETMMNILNIPYDLTIVIDKMCGKDFIVDGRVEKLNAVSGLSDLETYSLNKNNTIFSTDEIKGAFTTILSIKGIPKEANGKLGAYIQMCGDSSFIKLKDKLGF